MSKFVIIHNITLIGTKLRLSGKKFIIIHNIILIRIKLRLNGMKR